MARQLYHDIDQCRALVIDGNVTSRSILTGMLRDMGVVQIAQASRALDARQMLENRTFDVVLCDYHFDQSAMSGQELLDELRRAQLLPYATVFVMVTGEASYTRVAEAAEAALDGYLLKPHTAAALEQRVLQARHRKRLLGSIFEAIAEGDLHRAAAACEQRFEQRGEYALYAARIGAELWGRLGEHARAGALYEAVRAAQPVPWARLGIARVELDSGRLPQAGHTLQALVGDQPAYADAYDLLGQVQAEQGELAQALATCRQAVALTPASIVRLQKLGTLAFHAGEPDEATQALERAVRIGVGSKLFDGQSLMLLALLQHDGRDTKALALSAGHLERSLERAPDDARLRRIGQAIGVLHALLERRGDAARDALAALAAGIREADFDFEAASNLLAVLARAAAVGGPSPTAEAWVDELARRFCASKGATDLLCAAAQPHPAYVARVRAGHQGITTLAEKAMTHSLNGAHEQAVRALLELGRDTLNAKLLDMAGLVLNRHVERIADGAVLGGDIAELRQRFCRRGTQLALGSGHGRAAGGLNLRA